MTRAELETRVANYFENATYFTQTDLVNAIQDGYDESAAYSGAILKSATVAFVKDQTYYDLVSSIPDLLAVVAIFNSVNKRWLVPIGIKKFESERDDWETVIGTPEYFSVISYRYTAIYRKPHVDNFGNFIVFYKAAAPTVGSADTFLIEDEHLDAIETYCYFDLLAQQQEWVKATKEFKAYIPLLESLKRSVNEKSSDRIKGLKG